MASLILGITGKKRSGKDTFAARLIAHHGFTRVSFADPLRKLALAIDPWVRVEPDEVGIMYGPGTMYLRPLHLRLSQVLAHPGGWETAKEIREVRRLLQVIGTEGGRQVLGENIWVEAAARVADEIPGPVVITDVRFPNEGDFVSRYGVSGQKPHSDGGVVRIIRPGMATSDAHASETAMDGYPALDILNDGTVADLHDQADALVERLDL